MVRIRQRSAWQEVRGPAPENFFGRYSKITCSECFRILRTNIPNIRNGRLLGEKKRACRDVRGNFGKIEYKITHSELHIWIRAFLLPTYTYMLRTCVPQFDT